MEERLLLFLELLLAEILFQNRSGNQALNDRVYEARITDIGDALEWKGIFHDLFDGLLLITLSHSLFLLNGELLDFHLILVPKVVTQIMNDRAFIRGHPDNEGRHYFLGEGEEFVYLITVAYIFYRLLVPEVILDEEWLIGGFYYKESGIHWAPAQQGVLLLLAPKVVPKIFHEVVLGLAWIWFFLL